jgi:hypothetical protein
LADGALQRCEGWSGCRTPPLGDPCGLSGFRGTPGTRARRTRADMGSRPTRGRFDAFRVVVRRAVSAAEAELRPPLHFRAPSETCHCSPAPGQVEPDPEGTGDEFRDASSPGLWCPTTHAGTAVALENGDGSLRHRVPRTGFGYPLRDVHRRTSQRTRRRSVPGLRPPRRSPRHERCPSRGPCPPDVAGRSPPPRGKKDSGCGRLQGLVPVPSPCCRQAPEGARPSMPSWAFPLQSVPFIRPGDRL